MSFPLDTEHKLNVHKAKRRRTGHHETKRDKTHFFLKRNEIRLCEILRSFYMILS